MFGQPGAPPAGRPGDWVCPGCHDLQFAKNTTCRRCHSMKPGSGPAGMMLPGGGLVTGGYGSAPHQQMLAGDWICSRCRDHQFARNVSCRRCGAPRDGMQNPTTASLYGGEGGFNATVASGQKRTGFSDAQSSAPPKRGFSDAPPSGFHDRISKPPPVLMPGDQPYDPLQPPTSGNDGVVEALLKEKLAHGVPPPPEGQPPLEEKTSSGRTIFIWGPGANVDVGALAGSADRSCSRSVDRKRARKESRSSSRSRTKGKKKSRKAEKKSSKDAGSGSSSGSWS
jgi:hypothetical protein